MVVADQCSSWRSSSRPDSAGGCLRCLVAWRVTTAMLVSQTVAAGARSASSEGTAHCYTSGFLASV